MKLETLLELDRNKLDDRRPKHPYGRHREPAFRGGGFEREAHLKELLFDVRAHEDQLVRMLLLVLAMKDLSPTARRMSGNMSKQLQTGHPRP